MKQYQIYNSAIEDVLTEIDKWWETGECTQGLINRVKKLKRDAKRGKNE